MLEDKIFIENLGSIKLHESDPRIRPCVLVACPICLEERGMYKSNFKSSKTTKCTKCRNITHNKTNTRLYGIWSAIKQRCLNPKSPTFERYGGRGITICEEWVNDFQSFETWALSCPNYNDSLTIDRENNNLGYSPDNCRWADGVTQTNNRSIIGGNELGIPCITLDIKSSKWLVRYEYDLKFYYVGLFDSLDEAALKLRESLALNNISKYNI